MPMTQRQILAWRPIVLATLLLQAACSESAEPEPGGAGTIRIAIQTHGQPGDLDPDGYEVLRAGSVALEVPTNGEALLEDIPAGAHALSLAGLAPNCAVDIGPADPVTVTADDTVLAGWIVTCGYRPTSLTISFATPPDAAAGELTIRLNGQSPEPLRAGQAVTFDGLAHGGQSVTIGHSPNCRIEGPASRVLILRSAEEATLEIRGTCSAGRLLFDSNKRLWMLNADGSGLSEVRVPVNQITGLAVDRPIAETPALSRDGQHLAITVGGRGLYAL